MKGYLRISPVLAGVMMATGTVGAAGAQCVTTQDCKALGYTETSCSGGKGVKCPFGNGWYCGHDEVTPEQCSKLGFSYSCSGTGYAGGAGSACGGKYAQCKCSEGYSWNGNICKEQITNGADGDLYYCNRQIVGIKVPNTDFYIMIRDIGSMSRDNALDSCRIQELCNNKTARLLDSEEFGSIISSGDEVNRLLSEAGGVQFTDGYIYWTSTTGKYYAGGGKYYPNYGVCTWGVEKPYDSCGLQVSDIQSYRVRCIFE